MISSLFSKAKLILAGLVTIVVTVFLVMFKRTKQENKNLKKEVKAKDKQIKVQEIVNHQKINNIKLQVETEKTEAKIDKAKNDKMMDNIDKIENTPDGVEYEVKL